MLENFNSWFFPAARLVVREDERGLESRNFIYISIAHTDIRYFRHLKARLNGGFERTERELKEAIMSNSNLYL